jgi:anti-anti-sigma regulatory factor
MGQPTLRISIQENDQAIVLNLEGRLAGPWVAELQRVWNELMPRIHGKKLSLDLRNLTYSDAGGKRVLSEIAEVTRAELVASSPWTRYLADEIRTNKTNQEEAKGESIA